MFVLNECTIIYYSPRNGTPRTDRPSYGEGISDNAHRPAVGSDYRTRVQIENCTYKGMYVSDVVGS